MLASVGPYDPAVEFGVEFRSGNTKADQAAHAEGQRLFRGDGRPAQTEVEQGGFDSFFAAFHARGGTKLGPVVNLLFQMQGFGGGVAGFAVHLQAANQGAPRNPKRSGRLALIAGETLQRLEDHLALDLAEIAIERSVFGVIRFGFHVRRGVRQVQISGSRPLSSRPLPATPPPLPTITSL